MTHSALYELEPIGVGGKMEANGTIYHFCARVEGLNNCRNQFLRDQPSAMPRLMPGTTVDAIEDTVCDYCGQPLEERIIDHV